MTMDHDATGRQGRRPPEVAGHQAGAEAIARLHLGLRRRLQLHLGLDRHVHQPGGGLRRRRSGHGHVGLGHGHHRPVIRGPQLRRAVEPLPDRRLDLPVVEAPVAIGRSAGSPAGSTSGPGSITVTAVAATVPLVLSTIFPETIKLADRLRSRPWTCSPSWPSSRSSSRPSSTSRARASWPSSTTSAWWRRSWACSCSRIILLLFFNHQPISVVFDTSYTSEPGRRQLLGGLPGRRADGALRRLRLRHRGHVRGGDGRCRSPGAARRPRRDLVVGHHRLRVPARDHALVPGHERRHRARRRPSASRSPRRSSRT